MPLHPADPRALEALERAEAELAAKRPTEAIQAAERSQRIEDSGRAYALLTRAACSRLDLSRARAEFQKVPPALRGECIQWCRQFDIDLGAR